MRLSGRGALVLSSQLRAELERVLREAAELTRLSNAGPAEGPSPDLLWAIAGHLQAFYTGIEAMLARAIEQLDGSRPLGPDSHQELLRQAAIEIVGLRPRLLEAELVERLSPYRAFRHFFRHAYGVTLRWEKMEQKAREAAEVGQLFASAIAILRGFLDELGAAAEPPEMPGDR